MKRDAEPMTTLDETEWRAYKRATRNLRHKQRLERTTEADPARWLASIRRDDATDPALATVEREPREQVTA